MRFKALKLVVEKKNYRTDSSDHPNANSFPVILFLVNFFSSDFFYSFY